MDKIRNVLEMHEKKIPIKEITRVLGVSRNTARKYIRKYFNKPGADPAQESSNAEIAAVVFTAEKPPFNSSRHVTLIEHFNKELKHLVKRRGIRWLSGRTISVLIPMATVTVSIACCFNSL